MASSSSSSPIPFGLVGYNSDSSDSSVEIQEPQQIEATANSSLEVPQPSPDPGEGCSGQALQRPEEPEFHQPDCQEEPLAQPAGTSKRKPYAAVITQLSPELRSFLAAVRIFHTQKFNVQRQKAALSPSTYDKAQERMLCKLRLLFSVLFSVI